MEFTKAYQHVLHSKNANASDRNLYEFGMRVFQKANKLEKEEILLRLISVYPKDAELYFKMAVLFEGDLRSLAWHKICFTVDPCHKENIITIVQSLYEKGIGIRVFEYTDTPVFSDLIKDPRFLFVYARCCFQQLYYKNGVKHLLTLIEHYCKTPAIKPADKIAKWSNYHDLGYVYCIMGEIDLSLKYTKKAVELSNKFKLDMWHRLLSFSNSLCYADFKYSDAHAVFKDYLKINDYLPDNPMFSHHKKRAGEKIRIGYVSSDYMYHAIANFIIPILDNHDRSRFEIVLYANQPEFSTDIFVKLSLPYRLIKDKDDRDVAQMIYNDRIDILIDLNGHTVGNRLGVFRFKPAPVQITYLGYPNTTGLKSMQYRITDGIADTADSAQPYSERLIRLSRCFLLYKPFHQDKPVKVRTCGPEIILGAINKENKNSHEALSTWSTILADCPSTKILIKLETFDNIEERREFYVEHLRTSADRIIIVPKLDNPEYNQIFSRIDILLDSFPYSGTTTTCNSLFNSIPVVTLNRKGCHAHNVSSSILTHCGLGDFVAKSREQYISIVKSLVNEPEKIDEYKQVIHGKFRATIMDSAPFMRVYESALIQTLNP